MYSILQAMQMRLETRQDLVSLSKADQKHLCISELSRLLECGQAKFKGEVESRAKSSSKGVYPTRQ